VQRAAIVLPEKALPFERRGMDLANKPAWFERLSPLGKTPLLFVGGETFLESAATCECPDEVHAPSLHPGGALEGARLRARIGSSSPVPDAIDALYKAPDGSTLQARAARLRPRFERIDRPRENGPCVSEGRFCAVDAAFASALRSFDGIDRVDDFGLWAGLRPLLGWRAELAARPSVMSVVRSDDDALLQRFLAQRQSALSDRLQGARVEACPAPDA